MRASSSRGTAKQPERIVLAQVGLAREGQRGEIVEPLDAARRASALAVERHALDRPRHGLRAGARAAAPRARGAPSSVSAARFADHGTHERGGGGSGNCWSTTAVVAQAHRLALDEQGQSRRVRRAAGARRSRAASAARAPRIGARRRAPARAPSTSAERGLEALARPAERGRLLPDDLLLDALGALAPRHGALTRRPPASTSHCWRSRKRATVSTRARVGGGVEADAVGQDVAHLRVASRAPCGACARADRTRAARGRSGAVQLAAKRTRMRAAPSLSAGAPCARPPPRRRRACGRSAGARRTPLGHRRARARPCARRRSASSSSPMAASASAAGSLFVSTPGLAVAHDLVAAGRAHRHRGQAARGGLGQHEPLRLRLRGEQEEVGGLVAARAARRGARTPRNVDARAGGEPRRPAAAARSASVPWPTSDEARARQRAGDALEGAAARAPRSSRGRAGRRRAARGRRRAARARAAPPRASPGAKWARSTPVGTTAIGVRTPRARSSSRTTRGGRDHGVGARREARAQARRPPPPRARAAAARSARTSRSACGT